MYQAMIRTMYHAMSAKKQNRSRRKAKRTKAKFPRSKAAVSKRTARNVEAEHAEAALDGTLDLIDELMEKF